MPSVDLILRGTDTLSEEATVLTLFYLPSGKGSTLNGKTLLHDGARCFPFRINPFIGGGFKANRKSQKLSPLYKMAENLYSVPLNQIVRQKLAHLELTTT